jgi:hypothetical protein
MNENPFKEFNKSTLGKSMLKYWKKFILENGGSYAEDSIETADFYAGFKYAWEDLSEKIISLEKRIKLAEDCMSRSWELSIIPNGDQIVRPLKKYRENYPEVYKGMTNESL